MLQQNFERDHLLKSVRRQLEKISETKEQRDRVDSIIEAMRIVDRKYFVEDQRKAYLNEALSIGQQQSISQPFTVARVLQLTGIKPGNRILEVGSGSGWNACIAACLAYPGETISIERIPELGITAAAAAEEFLRYLKRKEDPNAKRLSKLQFKINNVFTMEEYENQYDKVIVTAGITPARESKLEDMARRLLKNGGRLVSPYVNGPLIIMEKNRDKIETRYSKDTFAFVTLIN